MSESCIDAYVALHWLEWNGGSLRLTVTGENICAQLRAGMSPGTGPTASLRKA